MKRITLTLGILLAFNSVYSQDIDFYLPDVNNEEQSFSDLKGNKLTVIDFWATWCKPCGQLLPKLNDIYQKYSGDINIIAVSIDGPRSMIKVKPFVSSLGIDFPVLLDPDQELSGELNINSIPALVMVNDKNEIVWSHEGYSLGDERKIEEKIELYLTK